MPEMKCAASPGGTPTTIILSERRVSTPELPRWGSAHLRRGVPSPDCWGKRIGRRTDSCARVPRYCRFDDARYDISCGGQFPEFQSVLRTDRRTDRPPGVGIGFCRAEPRPRTAMHGCL